MLLRILRAGDMLGEYEVMFSPAHMFSSVALKPSTAHLLLKQVSCVAVGIHSDAGVTVNPLCTENPPAALVQTIRCCRTLWS